MPGINWEQVRGNSQINMFEALKPHPTLSPLLNGNKKILYKWHLDGASEASVDSYLKRKARGAGKAVSRSPTARGVGATVAVAATAATGGVAAVVGAGAAVPLTACAIRLGILAGDKKIWGKTNIDKIKGEMSKFHDRNEKGVSEFNKARQQLSGTPKLEKQMKALNHIGRGMHHWAKRNAEAELLMTFLKQEFFICSDASTTTKLDNMWNTKLSADENDIAEIVKPLLNNLLLF